MFWGKMYNNQECPNIQHGEVLATCVAILGPHQNTLRLINEMLRVPVNRDQIRAKNTAAHNITPVRKHYRNYPSRRNVSCYGIQQKEKINPWIFLLNIWILSCLYIYATSLKIAMKTVSLYVRYSENTCFVLVSY